jgi:hypothetical protein
MKSLQVVEERLNQAQKVEQDEESLHRVDSDLSLDLEEILKKDI